MSVFDWLSEKLIVNAVHELPSDSSFILVLDEGVSASELQKLVVFLDKFVGPDRYVIIRTSGRTDILSIR